MNKSKTKITITAITLAISIVMLASASYAWFSISSAPEVSGLKVSISADRALLVSLTPNDEDFGQSINLGELFQYYAPLKPVSTADGVNWFIPAYYDNDTSGTTLKPIDQFIHDTTYQYGNVAVYKLNADGTYGAKFDENSEEYFEASNRGYYVYCTFYLKTELEDGCDVTLSVPGNHLEAWETNESNADGAKYGSYALANYEKATGDNGETIQRIDNSSQTALRVGFLIDEGTAAQRFVIYEPNAEQRSIADNKPNGQNQYVHGFQLQPNPDYTENSGLSQYLNYKNNSYIPTRPIGLDENGNRVLCDIPAGDLLVQMSSEWDNAALTNRITAGKTPNSNDVMTFGKFVTDNETIGLGDESPSLFEFTEGNIESNGVTMGLASQNMVVRLNQNEPKAIKMFIWIEGQDVDCWNDIASGSFFVNLEFAAQTTDPDD